MKRFLFAVTLAVAAGSTQAAPCVNGTIADYIALGASGCSIGNNNVGDFSATSLLTGATPIAAGDINVTAVSGGFGFGLDFTLAAGAPPSAGPARLLDILLGYRVGGGSLIGASVALAGSAATVDGAVTAITNVCADGLFSGFFNCGGASAGLVAVTTESFAMPFDSALLPISSFFDVFTEITLDGGLNGGATLTGPVSNRFAVPEPATSALAIVALLGLGITGRRRKHRPAPT